MLYLNNPLLTADGIINALKKITADQTKHLKSFKKKLASIFFPKMDIEQIKTEIESERFAEFPQLQVVLREIFFKDQHPGAINIAALADWTPPASYTDKTFQVLNARYGYFTEQSQPIFNTLQPLCRKMTQLVERQADDNEMAYKLMALFCEPQDFSNTGNCLKNISKRFIKISKQVKYGTPYHDAFVTTLHHFPSAVAAKNITGWRQFILKFGFTALPYFADCASFESVPKTLKEAQYTQLTKAYPRAEENPSFAQFCKAYRAKNDEFESGLDFIKTRWPKKEKDNLPLVDIKLIDKTTNTEYRWVKLPPNDLRALYLGIMLPGCCQVINGHSRQCVIDGTSLSDNGFYVLLKKKVKESAEESKEQEAGDLLDGDIAAQSYAWISQNGNLCLDSIEWDKARVTEPILKNLMDLFALAVFQQNPQIRYVNVGTGGQTPRNFSQIARIGERQRQGAQYGDSASQYCIKSRLNKEKTLELQKKLRELDESIQDKILYLAAYLDMTEISQEMIQEISSRLTSSFIQPFPIIHQPLTSSDFKTLTFENYQQLPTDEKIKVSTFCKLLNCNSLDSFAKWLSVIPESERLEAVKQKDENKDTILIVAAEDGPECLESILRLIPEPERLEAVKPIELCGGTVLHEAALNPECLEIILRLIPEPERLKELVKHKDQFGRTVLHCAADTTECLESILSLIPGPEHLEAVKQKDENGRTVLYEAALNPECLEIILSLIPEQERLEAVKQKNKNEMTVLHHAADRPECLEIILRLLSKQYRLEAVKQKDRFGDTVLHTVANKAKYLKNILSLIPELERLEAVKQKDENGRTVLDITAKSPVSSRIVLSLIPELERLEAVKQKVLFERTVLYAAAENPECLRIIPKKDLLNPEVQHVSSSLRIGICSRVSEFFITVANYFVGSMYIKKCM